MVKCSIFVLSLLSWFDTRAYLSPVISTGLVFLFRPGYPRGTLSNHSEPIPAVLLGHDTYSGRKAAYAVGLTTQEYCVATSFVFMTTLINALSVLIVIVPVLLAVAFMMLIERKVLAAMQRRVGPNVVGVYGVGQALQVFAPAPTIRHRLSWTCLQMR